jgi:tetratricopeptide (TPR) repeat protein
MITTLVNLLAHFYSLDDFSNVEAIARSIQACVPADQVSLQFLGLVYYRTGRIKDALRIFDKVDGKAPAETGEGESLPAKTAAAVCYEEATKDSPQLARAWYDLGNALLELRKFNLAIPAFRSSLSAQPEHVPAMIAIGQTALHVDDLAAAQEGFSRLRSLQPDNDEAYRGLGQVYRKRRDFAAARACFAWVRKLQAARRRKFALKRRAECSPEMR